MEVMRGQIMKDGGILKRENCPAKCLEISESVLVVTVLGALLA